ncbi:HK97 gp10 family phage protein [Tepidimicrobium xylanilyticum]
MKELEKSLKKLGKVPQKHVTASARKAMNIVLKQSRAAAPYETGALKKGIKMVGERSRQKGKKVYRIVFDRNMNHIFQKPVKNPGESGHKGARKIAYYPYSQEYGFFARDGKYIPGYRFISDSLTDNVSKIEKTIVSEMKKKIDAEIAKAGLK